MLVLEAAASLTAVLALIWVLARLARSTGIVSRKSPRGRTLQIEEVVSLDSHRRLVLVNCGSRQVVLMTGGKQDLVVGWLTPDEITK